SSCSTAALRASCRPRKRWREDRASRALLSARARPCSSVNRDLAPAGRVAGAAEHALGAEVHDDPPACADRNQSTVAAERGKNLVQQLTHRLLEGEGAVLDRGAHVVGGHGAYEILAVPGR